MKQSITPLRFPGGKSWLLEYVKSFLKFHNLKDASVIEPFAGSASISIGLLEDGIIEKAYICESDPLIVSFWLSVLEDNEELVELVKSVNVSIDTWWAFKKYLEPDAINKFSRIELALAFIFYNRTNYSGIIKAGPLGGKKQRSNYKIGCRFNKEQINKKIRNLRKFSEKLQVFHDDGVEFMKRARSLSKTDNLFFYVDPPYYKTGRQLYRDYFTEKDHLNLANYLTKVDLPWLLSYDDSEFIKNIYTKTNQTYVYTDYQSRHNGRSIKELLISNYRIPPQMQKIELYTQIIKKPKQVVYNKYY